MMTINYSDLAFRIVTLLIAIAAGWVLFPFTANILIYLGLYPENALENNFGLQMIQKSIGIWVLTTLLSFIYLFTKRKIRYFFLLLPVIAPSLFAFLYTLNT